MTELIHVERNGVIVSIFGDWEFVNSGGTETIEEAGYGFSDGDKPNNIEINNAADFVGVVAHLIQQTGGFLIHKSKAVSLIDMKDTGGGRLNLNARVKYDGNEMLFKDIK
jgi:hypothetical protein